MARFDDMEGLATRNITAYNDGGLLIGNGQGTYYQLGVFPLYNCGNMLTILSAQGRPQFPNYTGYDFDPILQFERRGNQALCPHQSGWRDMDEHARLTH